MKTTRLFVAVKTVGLLCLSAGMLGCKQEKETVARTATEQQVDDALTEQVKTAFGNRDIYLLDSSTQRMRRAKALEFP